MKYISYGQSSIGHGGGLSWEFITKRLFITPYNGSESAGCSRSTLKKRLQEVTGLILSSFENRFTFVTDCAGTMPRVFGASVSLTKVPLSER